jgi:hypothetical protein
MVFQGTFTNASEKPAYLLVGAPKGGGLEVIRGIFVGRDQTSGALPWELARDARNDFARLERDFYWEVERIDPGETFSVEVQDKP